MKKLAILLLTVLTLTNCGNEVEFNSPAFQGNRDYGQWRAEFTTAAIDENGFLTIRAGNNIETVTLTIPSVAVGSYTFGDVNSMEARYVDASGKVYSTNYRPDPEVSIYPEYGFVKINEINSNTFTGTFEFLAFDESGLNSIGYNVGIFFRVPLTSGSIPAVVITCDDTEIEVTETRGAYLAAFSPSPDYIDRDTYFNSCIAYTEALIIKRDYCGDVDGLIAEEFVNLNNCMFPCDLALQNRITAQAAFEVATLGTYLEACNNYAFYLQEQIDACGDEDGSIQADLEGLNCADDDADGIPNVFEDFNADGDFDNDDTDLDGIANYLDNDDDGDGVLTIDEAKDMDGNPVDTDGDLDADYLDNDDDNDGLFSNFETGDTDADGILDYLDADDDDDTILTISENADPNLDGDPADALDGDADGIPDYLDNM